MEKQTKNIITREWVEKELRFYNRAGIRSNLRLLLILSPIFLPLTIWLAIGYAKEFGFSGISALVGIFIIASISIGIWIPICLLTKHLFEKRLIDRGDFEITESLLSEKAERRVIREFDRRIERQLSFPGFKWVTPSSHVIYELATRGDKYYLVHYKNKRTIKFCYPAKMYEYVKSDSHTEE